MLERTLDEDLNRAPFMLLRDTTFYSLRPPEPPRRSNWVCLADPAAVWFDSGTDSGQSGKAWPNARRAAIVCVCSFERSLSDPSAKLLR